MTITLITITITLSFVGFLLTAYLVFFWWPTFGAKRELQKYFESAKETFVYDGGLMHDAEFRGVEHRIFVKFPKPAQRFQAEVNGTVMIKDVKGKYFHIEWKDVPEEIKVFWQSCQNK